MSSIAYHRSSSPSASSSDSRSSDSDSPRRGAYVPLHKRSPPSSTTSVSEPSSSRSASPSKRREAPGSPSRSVSSVSSPRIYTIGYLLSLRPFATEGLKEQMRTTCAEVVMNRRMRKSIEFNENQARGAAKALLAQQRLLQQQEQLNARPHWQQRHTYLPVQAPPPPPSHPTHAHLNPMAMPPPRRARLVERNTERRLRENAIQHNTTNWNTLENSNSPLVAA